MIGCAEDREKPGEVEGRNPEDLMRPRSAEPIGASGHATTASTGRTHDRKAT